MSKVVIKGDASGTGTLTIAAPNTNSDVTFNLPTSGGTIQALSAWSFVESGTTLYIKYNGTNVGKIDSSGNLTVVGNVTAYGTV